MHDGLYRYIYICTCSFSYALYTCLDAGAGVYISVAMAMVYAYCLIFHAKTAAVATKARTTADNTVIEIHALSCAYGNCSQSTPNVAVPSSKGRVQEPSIDTSLKHSSDSGSASRILHATFTPHAVQLITSIHVCMYVCMYVLCSQMLSA